MRARLSSWPLVALALRVEAGERSLHWRAPIADGMVSGAGTRLGGAVALDTFRRPRARADRPT